jgi:hypothetical protein
MLEYPSPFGGVGLVDELEPGVELVMPVCFS